MIADNFADLVRMNALRFPAKTALVDGASRVTHAELHAALMAVAGALRDRGVGRGDIVGVAMHDTLDHVVAMLAVIRVGAVLLPMDVRWTVIERVNVAAAFGATAVLADDNLAERLGAVPVIGFDPAFRAHAPIPPPPMGDLDAPMVLSLSSGTTGLPKGPMLTHRQMMLRNQSEWIGLGYSQDDVFLCATPLYFGGGRGFTLSYLSAGATVVLAPPPLKLPDLAAIIRREGATTCFLVPTQLRRLAAESEAVREAFRRLRLIVSSGSALHQHEAEALRGTASRILNLYASTEGGAVSILYPGEEGAGSVGRPALGSTVSIATEEGEALGSGQTGLIRHRAPWHPAGFHNNATETARWFRDGWYYTGDVGHLDAAGFLHITGRVKDMIIRGGVNIYPDEIEAAVIAHPAVADASVIGLPAGALDEEVVAFYVAAGTVSPEALRAHCQARLAPYKVPSAFHAVEELPRNPGGKVLKAVLRQRLEAATP